MRQMLIFLLHSRYRKEGKIMKLKLPVLLAAGVVAMGLLLGANTAQALTEHLIPLYGFLLDEDAEATFPVTAAVTPADEADGGGGGGGGSSSTCFIDTVSAGFFPSIFSMSGDDYKGRVSERSSQSGKRPSGWRRGRIHSSRGDRSQ